MKNLFCCLLALVFWVAPAVAAEKPLLYLTFGVYSSDKPSVMYGKFRPILDYLEKNLATELDRRVQIEIRIFKDYDSAIEALVKGEVDFVRFGPSSYVLAKERNPEIQLLAMEERKGRKRFNGVVIVKADSPFKKLSDLKGQRFAFGNANSTIGRYLVQAELVKAGVSASDLRSLKYLGRHDKVCESVKLGDFEAGSVKETTFNKCNSGRSLRILHSFKNVTKPWIAKAELEPKVFTAIRKFLLSLQHSGTLSKLKVTGFLRASDGEYELVREGMELSKQFHGKEG